MGVWAKMLLGPYHTYAAATGDENVPVNHIKYLDISRRADQDGTTNVTIANYLAGLPTIVVKLGGIRICNLSLADLLALNLKWMEKNPQITQIGGGDDYFVSINPIRLLLYVDKKGREMSAQFGYAAITNADGNAIDVKYTYRDTPFSERRSLHYAYETFSGTGAASVRTNISRAGAQLIGLLVWSQNVPKATDNVGAGTSPEASELDVIVDDRVVYSDSWRTRGDEHSPINLADDTTLGAISVHYQWISFEEQPWPADKIWVVTRNTVSTEGTAGVDTFRLIPVYIEP